MFSESTPTVSYVKQYFDRYHPMWGGAVRGAENSARPAQCRAADPFVRLSPATAQTDWIDTGFIVREGTATARAGRCGVHPAAGTRRDAREFICHIAYFILTSDIARRYGEAWSALAKGVGP